MSQETTPVDWPAVGPLSRFQMWWCGLVTVLLTAAAVLMVIDDLLPGGPPVRVPLAVVGAVLALAAPAWVWWAILRGTPLRVVRQGALTETLSWPETVRLRRTLRSGGDLADGECRWIARQLAASGPMRLVLAGLATVTGVNLLSLSTLDGPVLPYLVALNAGSVVALLAVIGILAWVRTLHGPAEAVGAVPVRIDG